MSDYTPPAEGRPGTWGGIPLPTPLVHRIEIVSVPKEIRETDVPEFSYHWHHELSDGDSPVDGYRLAKAALAHARQTLGATAVLVRLDLYDGNRRVDCTARVPIADLLP